MNFNDFPKWVPLLDSKPHRYHKQLYNKLEARFPDPLDMWHGTIFGGWLEYHPQSQTYTLSPVVSDGSHWNDLTGTDKYQMQQSLKEWAQIEGVYLEL